MRRFFASSRRLTMTSRITAWSCVWMMALLVWLSADPSAHARLHGLEQGCHDHSATGHAHDDESLPENDGCAVAKFAQGHVDCAVLPCLFVGATIHLGAVFAGKTPSLLTQGDLLLPPVCGPPAA